MIKKCSKCGIKKDISEFYCDSKRKDGKNSWCKVCVKLQHKNKYHSNPEIRKQIIARTNEYRKSNPHYRRLAGLRKKLGLKPKEVSDYCEARLQEQNGCCDICGVKLIEEDTVLDHNHETGKLRGLLCHCCNRGLGFLKEDLDILSSMSSYLINN